CNHQKAGQYDDSVGDEKFKKAEMRKAVPSQVIQTYVESEQFSVVREYVGHGVGQDLHEDPQIPHYGPPNKGPRLKPGMVLAIEPMVNAGTRYVKTLADNWTVVTVDGKKCAHFEHTIAITDAGFEILTKA
ncbi:M24 family metallopeptidase, partial [Bacillus haynesii]|uniref:M24 family metallopeptidase n=1 Tax=Bacillus haynesii TaxID=1925021 RepID=UPI003CFBEDC9